MIESEVTQKELEDLRKQRMELDSQIHELEAEEEERKEELAEKAKGERRALIESQLRTKYLLLVEANWRKIPEFLNRSYKQLEGMAEEYAQLADEETRLTNEIQSLKRDYAILGGDWPPIHSSVIAEISSVKLNEDLKHLLDLIVANQSTWMQMEGVVLRFLDVHRARIKSNW